MYTEDEARKKRCPASMSGRTYQNCIASGCMAWRWQFDEYEYAETESVQEGIAMRAIPPDDDPNWENIEFKTGVGRLYRIKWRKPKPTTRGFCGLAGKGE